MDTKIIPTKSFREVHKELENEVLFLHKNHDIKDFKEKADFLSGLGFNNSISTKVYSAISEKYDVIQKYKRNYSELHKFILRPQLERLCEKYDLYVRNVDFFLGDIPEKNIRDMMNFSVIVDDLPINEMYKNEIKSPILRNNPLSEFTPRLPLSSFKKYGLVNLIEIASVKSLFSEKAFERSNERIVGNIQIDAKNMVDLDPIVLCRTNDGYLIVTAWGDEANDELVFNEKMN